MGKPNERKEVCKEEWESLGRRVGQARRRAGQAHQGSGGAGFLSGNYCTSSQSRAGLSAAVFF